MYERSSEIFGLKARLVDLITCLFSNFRVIHRSASFFVIIPGNLRSFFTVDLTPQGCLSLSTSDDSKYINSINGCLLFVQIQINSSDHTIHCHWKISIYQFIRTFLDETFLLFSEKSQIFIFSFSFCITSNFELEFNRCKYSLQKNVVAISYGSQIYSRMFSNKIMPIEYGVCCIENAV